MSLTLPPEYGNLVKLGNITENWIIQLGFDEAFDPAVDSGGTAVLLDGGINNSVTTLDVDAGTGIVFAVGDRIKLSDEIMLITGIATDTLTIVRGYEGSTAASHSDEAVINFYNFRELSVHPVRFGTVNYRGVIDQKLSIRTSFDLARSQAKSGNITLKINNFKYQGDEFSAELFSASGRKYINRVVKIYSALTGATSIADCLQIASMRMMQPSHNDDTITIPLVEARPWDNLSIPNEKTTELLIDVPVSYGQFNGNSVTDFETPLFTTELANKTLRPLPYNKTADSLALYVNGVDLASGAQLAHYEKGIDVFVPYEDADFATTLTDGAEHSTTDPLERRSFKTRPDTYEAITGALSDPEKAINTNAADYAYKTVTIVEENSTTDVIEDFKVKSVSGERSIYPTTVKDASGQTVTATEEFGIGEPELDVSYGGNLFPYDVIIVGTEHMNITGVAGNTLTVERGFNGTEDVVHVNGIDIYQDNTVTVLGFKYEIVWTSSVGAGTNVSFRMETDGGDWTSATFTGDFGPVTAYLNLTNATEKVKLILSMQSDGGGGLGSLSATFRLYDVFIQTKRISSEVEDEVYTGSVGLTKSGSWNSAGDYNNTTAVKYGHEAHRDMLIRFTGLSADIPYNWNDTNPASGSVDVDNIKANGDQTWDIRWWTLKSMPVKRALAQMQYEFGFIFKWRADGSPSYWCVQDSYSTVAATLTDSDGKLLSIKSSPFSELITQMEINYQKHPTGDGYVASDTGTNSTARDDWNIGTLENIEQVDLDMNVLDPVPAGTDPNDGFYRYYDNIFGTVKILVDYEITNPKYYGLETGDPIKFNLSSVDPFGFTWSDKFFMIYDLNRSFNSIKIKCREVYSL